MFISNTIKDFALTLMTKYIGLEMRKEVNELIKELQLGNIWRYFKL